MAQNMTEARREIATGEVTDSMGPAMKALGTDRMRAFVICLQDGPNLNYARAAREAGYSGTNQSIYNAAYRLAHDPKVLAAIAEEAHRRLHASLGWSVGQLINLGQAAKSDADKQRALTAIMDRTGLGVQTTHNVNVTHKDERSPKEMLAAYFHVAKQLGIQEPMKLLGAPVVDAEFVEVEEDLGPL